MLNTRAQRTMLYYIHKIRSKQPFWSLWFGQFCHFSPKLILFASGSLWFQFIAILVEK
ncbi:hypothetical protein Hanom_Chr05g00389931 [Helianthus anomalus]